ncbi:hypothetical protein [Actinocorallia populi]|uniref:hypothetical protein n=1 Tax=Actinocorallia populi TaxID=2079200 RepID=UPI0013001867|nr:hypothetical protein [Actinocorallia populi]
MRRIATVGLAAGSLVLGMAAHAVPAGAEEAAAPSSSRAKPVAKGGFKSKNGRAKAFRDIEASGSYQVTHDRITVRFKVRDKKRDGWTPAVQFAALEAWDGEGTGLYFPLAKNLRNGRGTPNPNQSGTIAGPPISNTVEPKGSEQPECRSCSTVKPRPKPKPKKGPADGRYTFKFKKSFSSKYTEYLAVREVLLRKKGKKYQYKVGPTTIVYAASEGPHLALDPAQNARTADSGGVAVQRRVVRDGRYKKALRDGLASSRRAIPKGWTHFTNKKLPGQLDGNTETWGYFTGYRNDSGGTNARLTLRVRDNKADRRYAGTIVAFTNADASVAEEWALSNLQDLKGRWTSRVVHSAYTDHLLYQSCVGLYDQVDGRLVFVPTTCGEPQVLY